MFWGLRAGHWASRPNEQYCHKNLNASNSDLLSSTKMAHHQVSFDILCVFLVLTISANDEVTK